MTKKFTELQAKMSPAMQTHTAARAEAALGNLVAGITDENSHRAVDWGAPVGREVDGPHFHERGEAAWQHHLRTDVAVPVDEALGKLQAKLDAKRRQLG